MTARRVGLVVLLTSIAACGDSDPRRLPSPPEVTEAVPPDPVPAGAISAAAEIVRDEVEREAFPGAVLAIGNRGLIQYMDGFGRTHWAEDAPRADPDSTLYDLASVTKVIATTAAVMALVEEGRMELDAPVRRYLPAFSGEEKDRVTIRQLLSHMGGVRAGATKFREGPPREVERELLSRPLALPPGQDVLYSDLGFVVLWAAAEAAAGEPLQRYLQRKVWGPLGMESTAVGLPQGCPRCAPTLYLNETKEPYRGGSYDEVGRRLDGVTGNAGAFSTGADVARFTAMIANEGRLGDVRVFDRETVREFTRPQPGAGTRALGWEVYCEEGIVPDHRSCGEVLALGHTGVTGTSLWIDPESRSWVVLLTNRTYLPRSKTEMQELRRELFEAVVGDGSPS